MKLSYINRLDVWICCDLIEKNLINGFPFAIGFTYKTMTRDEQCVIHTNVERKRCGPPLHPISMGSEIAKEASSTTIYLTII